MTECLNPDDFDALRNEGVSPHRCQALRLHIAACDACREELEALQRVDAMILDAYTAIEPRAKWLADMQAILADDSIRVDTKTVQVNYRPHHFTVLRFALTTAAMLLIVATLAAWFFKSDNKQPLRPTDKFAQDSNSTNAPNSALNRAQIDQTVDIQSVVPKVPTVLAHGDFLVGRHPGEDDEIELYWVLPIQRKH